MIRKKYEVAGMMEWHPVFKVGRSRLQVSFTGGHLCGGATTAASYETADPVVQAIIERSAAFRSGRIRLAWQKEMAGVRDQVSGVRDQVSGVSGQKSETGGMVSLFEYDNIEDVYEFLQHDKGVPLSRLTNKDSCNEEAKRLGITLKKKV